MLVLASKSKRLLLWISCSLFALLLVSCETNFVIFCHPSSSSATHKENCFPPWGANSSVREIWAKIETWLPVCHVASPSFVFVLLFEDVIKAVLLHLSPPLPSTPAVTALALNLLISQICRQPVFFSTRALRKWLNTTFCCLNIVLHSTELCRGCH